MTDSGELTDQAQTHMQTALEESEAKYLELVAKLMDGQTPDPDIRRDIERFRQTSAQLRALVASGSAKAQQPQTPLSDSDHDAAEACEAPADGEEAVQTDRRSSLSEFGASKLHYEDRILSLRRDIDTHAATIEALERQIVESRRAQERQQNLLKEREIRITELSAAYEARLLEKADGTETAGEQIERIASLEQQLNSEREYAENLNELANERAEEITRVTEKFEEAQERYEEAKWELGKAKYFEKLVRRRKKLIAKLIAAIRAKQKANLALKAGIDGLRNYKARAEQKQQELLRRIDTLENSLSEAREKANASRQDNRSSDDNANLAAESARLREKTATQAELIEQLESDLRESRVMREQYEGKEHEIERLNDTIETKNSFIGSLQKEFDEQQKNAAKLRKLKLELRVLDDAAEADKKHIEALEKENAKMRKSKPQDGSTTSVTLPGNSETIKRLSATVQEYEKTIAALSEAVEHWKGKYDFLAADSPFGYDTVTKSS